MDSSKIVNELSLKLICEELSKKLNAKLIFNVSSSKLRGRSDF